MMRVVGVLYCSVLSRSSLPIKVTGGPCLTDALLSNS